MGIIDECLNEIKTEQVLKAGVCPIIEALFRGTQGDVDPEDDITAFCAVCPDGNKIPDACPELQRDSRHCRASICILYRNLPDRRHSPPQGKCVYAQPKRTDKCTCFTPKGKEWHEEFDRWNAHRKRDEERIRKWNLGGNAYSDW